MQRQSCPRARAVTDARHDRNGKYKPDDVDKRDGQQEAERKRKRGCEGACLLRAHG